MTWPRMPLGDVLSLEYGKALKAADRNSTGEILVAGSNGPNGTHSEALVKGPGVVVGRKGSAGKVVWYEKDFWPIDTTYFVVPKVEQSTRWAYYLLHSLALERLAVTTGVPGLNRNDAYRVEVSLPPPSEQRRIVEFLDQADALRMLRAEADSKAARILPALFTKIFGNPMSWRDHASSEPLGDLVDLVSGATPSKKETAYWNGDIPWVSPKDMKMDFIDDSQDHVTKKAIEETNLKLLDQGNVLLVVRGMILAHSVPVALTNAPVTINQDMKALILKVNEITGKYLWAALKVAKPLLQSLVRTAAHGTRKLDTPDLLQLRLPIPKPDQLVACESAIDICRAVVERAVCSREKLHSLFNALLNRAFSGELTATWRQAHMKELLHEMEQQARELGPPAEEVPT